MNYDWETWGQSLVPWSLVNYNNRSPTLTNPRSFPFTLITQAFENVGPADTGKLRSVELPYACVCRAETHALQTDLAWLVFFYPLTQK